MQVSPKSDEQQRNEVYVTRTAKELAKNHICDVLQATLNSLTRISWNLHPSHRVHLSDETKAAGEAIANRVMANLLDDAPIKYREMVNEANEDDDVIDEDTIQTDLTNYVSDLMQKWVK